MKPIDYLMGKIISANVTESVELRILKQQLTDVLERITGDESIVRRFQDILDVLIKQAQTDAKFDGYIFAMMETENALSE